MSDGTPLAPDPGGALAARADLCRLLSACYYEPGAELAEERVFESLAQAAARLDAPLAGMARRVGVAFDSTPIDELLVDHARLFMGPESPLARPYASSWIDDPGAAARLQEFYASGGFEVSDAFGELPDHVAAELEFLYLLLFSEARARGAGETAAATSFSAVRRQFLADHLSRWIGPFTRAVEQAAGTDYHRSLAALTCAFVANESQLAAA